MSVKKFNSSTRAIANDRFEIKEKHRVVLAKTDDGENTSVVSVILKRKD